jgi:ArsR family transcriptional regulator, arsenate/arsenite/antimonite-responsive transcriptional repressor
VIGRKEGLWMHYRLSKPTAKLHQTVVKTVCYGRSECEEFERDIKTLNKNRDCLVGCCQ